MGIELDSQEYSYLITLITVLHILGWISIFEVGMISEGIVDFIGEVCNGAGRQSTSPLGRLKTVQNSLLSFSLPSLFPLRR